MATKSGRTTPCNAIMRSGRQRKAMQFYAAASDITDLATDPGDICDAYVTLLVHAGIAAADVLCCASLGEHAQGDNHVEAVALLGKFDADRAKDLRVLLQVKTKAAYSHQRVSVSERVKVRRACDRLMEAIEELVG